MVDVMLDFERLRTAKAGLDASVAELSAADDINDALEDAIGRPDERTGLRDKASDFESAWDDKRGKLKNKLENIQSQLQAILDGWANWEAEVVASIDTGPNATTNVNVVR